MEEEKKIIHQIILDVWDLTKKYVFQPLDDNGWNKLIYEANKLSNKYKKDLILRSLINLEMDVIHIH